MCRIGAIKSKNPVQPSMALRLMLPQQEGHDNSGFAMVMQDLYGVFGLYKDKPLLSMACTQQVVQPVEDKKKKKGTQLTQIVYNVPGSCAVNVLYKGRSLGKRAIPVAQLGVDVSLPKSWFTGKELPKITFSEKTGNIVSVSK